ncbi:CPK1 [Symbiodinium natans]|uniref:CPK1 protein n=1 Tax=Symbiodinium natans TaxID=878477 RepID=A0A812T404_9DINO|nr:CPK1 [Symbiodinium natans]
MSDDLEDSQSDSSEVDCKVWSLRRRIACRGRSKPMPPMEAWQRPPGAVAFGHKFETALAAAARRLARHGGASPKSYWIPAAAQPASVLQRFALQVFRFHTGRLGFTTKAIKRLGGGAGAEFWVQRRGAEVKKARRGMNWHFDKDEELLDDYGLCVHPLVATATYLTDQGAPLVILSAPTLRRKRDGAPEAEAPPHSPGSAAAFVAFPARGLHVAFGGDLLHGVPAELEHGGGERLALLVNVWLHHRPSGLQTCGKCGGAPAKGPTKPGSALRVRRRRCQQGGIAIAPGLAKWRVNGVQSL